MKDVTTFSRVVDVFAADVMYHVNCLTKYLRSFERAVEDILNPSLNDMEQIFWPILPDTFKIWTSHQEMWLGLWTSYDDVERIDMA